jgi:hypothetical protein
MPALCRAYTTEDDARAAVQRLLAAGVDGTAVRVLMGEPPHDSREAPAGEFAGTSTDAGERVGSFAGAGHARRDAMGAFTGGASGGRQGGFADRDTDTVADYAGGVERVRIASHGALKRMLVEAGLDEPTAAADVAALHAGRVLVLVTDASDGAARAVDAA